MKNTQLIDWLRDNAGSITHFRPRRWCGVEMLVPYDRRRSIPMLDCPFIIPDDADSVAAIRETLGAGMIEDRFDGIAGSNNY